MATGNTAKNDITGQYIKSRTYTKEARDRHGDIFAKRTFNDWLDIEGIDNVPCKLGGKFITEEISYSDFKKQLAEINAT